MQLALMMIRGEGPRSTEQAPRERVAVVRASVATLPRVVEAVVVKALAPEIFVTEFSHNMYVKIPAFENYAHLERGLERRGSLETGKNAFQSCKDGIFRARSLITV
jgi:hypothetical protein